MFLIFFDFVLNLILMWKKYPEIGEGIFILKLVWMYCIEINAEKNVFKLVQGRSRRAYLRISTNFWSLILVIGTFYVDFCLGTAIYAHSDLSFEDRFFFEYSTF